VVKRHGDEEPNMNDPSRPEGSRWSIEWSPQRLARLNREFENADLEDLARWGLDTFGDGICLATSFGPQSIVLMHQISRLRPSTTVFYLDTDLLFPETYDLRDELSLRLDMTFTRVSPDLTVEEQAELHGPRLWSREPDRCCYLRKVAPLRRFLRGKQAWITGVRNGHSTGRSLTEPIEWDPVNGLVKLNPLVRWSGDQVWSYLRAHDLPSNPLHVEGYASIGCRPCTRQVRPGDDPRSGRWSGFEKTECGIHYR